MNFEKLNESGYSGSLPHKLTRCGSLLTSQERDILYQLNSWYSGNQDRNTEPAWTSQTKLAASTGLSERQIRRITTSLESKGVIRIKHGKGKQASRYWINWGFFAGVSALPKVRVSHSQETQTSPDKDVLPELLEQGSPDKDVLPSPVTDVRPNPDKDVRREKNRRKKQGEKNPFPKQGQGNCILDENTEQPLSLLIQNIKSVMEQAERTVPGLLPSKKDLSEELALMLVEIMDKEGDVLLAPKSLFQLIKAKINDLNDPCWSVLIRWPSLKEELSALVRFAKNREARLREKDEQNLKILPDVIEEAKKEVLAAVGIHQEGLLTQLNGYEASLLKVRERLGLPTNGLSLSSLASLGSDAAPKASGLSMAHEDNLDALLNALN